MNRRTFIVSTSVGLAGALLLPGCESESNNPTSLTLIWERDTLIEIGNKYRATYPEEDNKDKLLALVSKGNAPDVETKVREDFAAGKHVMVDGWMLSITEARQCALLSFTPSNA